MQQVTTPRCLQRLPPFLPSQWWKKGLLSRRNTYEDLTDECYGKRKQEGPSALRLSPPSTLTITLDSANSGRCHCLYESRSAYGLLQRNNSILYVLDMTRTGLMDIVLA